jgi:hypothetical protein
METTAYDSVLCLSFARFFQTLVSDFLGSAGSHGTLCTIPTSNLRSVPCLPGLSKHRIVLHLSFEVSPEPLETKEASPEEDKCLYQIDSDLAKRDHVRRESYAEVHHNLLAFIWLAARASPGGWRYQACPSPCSP